MSDSRSPIEHSDDEKPGKEGKLSDTKTETKSQTGDSFSSLSLGGESLSSTVTSRSAETKDPSENAQLAAIYFLKGEFKSAAKHIKEALKEKQIPEWLLLQFKIHFALGNLPEKTSEAIPNAAQLESKSPTTNYYLGWNTLASYSKGNLKKPRAPLDFAMLCSDIISKLEDPVLKDSFRFLQCLGFLMYERYPALNAEADHFRFEQPSAPEIPFQVPNEEKTLHFPIVYAPWPWIGVSKSIFRYFYEKYEKESPRFAEEYKASYEAINEARKDLPVVHAPPIPYPFIYHDAPVIKVVNIILEREWNLISFYSLSHTLVKNSLLAKSSEKTSDLSDEKKPTLP